METTAYNLDSNGIDDAMLWEGKASRSLEFDAFFGLKIFVPKREGRPVSLDRTKKPARVSNVNAGNPAERRLVV